MCDFNTIVERDIVLGSFRKIVREAPKGPNGEKRICVYFSGHGSNGDWLFVDGTITLQDIVDQLDEKDIVTLYVYSDCCNSGSWIKKLIEHQVTAPKSSKVTVVCYTACD